MSHQEKEKMRVQLTKETEDIRAATKSKEDQIKVMENNMLMIKDFVKGMVDKFRAADHTFPLMVAKHMQYDNDT